MNFLITCRDRGYDVRENECPVDLPTQITKVFYSVLDENDNVFHDKIVTGTFESIVPPLESAGYCTRLDETPKFLRLGSVDDSPVVEYKCDKFRHIYRRTLLPDGTEAADGQPDWRRLLQPELREIQRGVQTDLTGWLRWLNFSILSFQDRPLERFRSIHRCNRNASLPCRLLTL